MRILNELRRYDRQLVLHFDPERQRWVVLRMGERYGTPKDDYTHGEVIHAKREGALSEVFVCQDNEGGPLTPGSWLFEYFRAADTRRINFRQYVREMDERNEQLERKAEEDASDALRYGVKQNWKYIREALRGNDQVNPQSVPVPKKPGAN